MRIPTVTAIAFGVAVALAGCGEGRDRPPAPLPSSGTAYRALADGDRFMVAEDCRNRLAARARGVAARQLQGVDPKALRMHLDLAFRIIADRHRQVDELCREHLPFVTPGLRVSISGATDDGDGTYSYQTTSDKRLTIRGRVSPVAGQGLVTVRREADASIAHEAQISADGSFVIPRLRLRKLADNTFILAFDAPPNAARKVYFSAICLDCLAGGAPPSGRQ